MLPTLHRKVIIKEHMKEMLNIIPTYRICDGNWITSSLKNVTNWYIIFAERSQEKLDLMRDI